MKMDNQICHYSSHHVAERVTHEGEQKRFICLLGYFCTHKINFGS